MEKQINVQTIMKLLWVILVVTYLAQGVYAQALQSAPVKESTTTVSRGSSALVTNTAGAAKSAGKNIQVSGVNSNALNFNKSGSVTIPESRGRSTQIRTSSDGGVMIREPGQYSVTTVSPVSDGGVIVMGRDQRPIFVSPNGTVRSFGHDNKSSRVITSGDGSRVTVWGRDGRTYTIPMPED